jgi:Zn-dependent M28 family amino/carboxypeptidase
MKYIIIFCTALLLLLIVVISCNKTDIKVEENLPYPTISEQRMTLATKPWAVPTRLLDSLQVIKDLEYLASAVCEGRWPGTAGHAKAVDRIVDRMRSAGIDSLDNSLTSTFLANTIPRGINIAGWVRGTVFPEKYIVVSAHYDHLGKITTGIFYGADDNASSVACLLSLAAYFKNNPHPYSIIFVALDKEETGLEGAYNFVQYLQTTNRLASVRFNLNLDMIARSDRNEIFACGIKKNPSFKYVIDEVQSKVNVKLLMGHDEGSGGDDWTNLSDHSAFNQKGIPFLYIGVEDHADYHQTTDTYQKINYSSYIENCNMIALMVKALKP